MTPVDALTPQQSNVLADLLAGETISAAARNHGIHRATIHNWLRDHLCFRAAMSLGRARLQTALFDTIQDLALEALDRIRHILADPGASASVQLRAAALILKMARPACPSADPAGENGTVEVEPGIRQNSTPPQPAGSTNGTFRYSTPPPGRNQPCPCNSGRKYKHCCLDKPRPADQ